MVLFFFFFCTEALLFHCCVPLHTTMTEQFIVFSL